MYNGYLNVYIGFLFGIAINHIIKIMVIIIASIIVTSQNNGKLRLEQIVLSNIIHLLCNTKIRIIDSSDWL